MNTLFGLSKSKCGDKNQQNSGIEGPTKTRQGGLKNCQYQLTWKLMPTAGPHCPVQTLLSKWPLEIKSACHLYLSPLCGFQANQWESIQSTTTWREWLRKLD